MARVMSYTPHYSEQRRKSPLGQFGAWCVQKAAGTALEKPMSFFIKKSLIGRVAVCFTTALIVGALFDFAFGFMAIPHSFIVCAILGALGGAAAQGAGGAMVGTIWGWLLGKIIDSIVSKSIYDPIHKMVGMFAAWCIAASLGWFAGRLAFWCFEKLTARYYQLRWMLKTMIVTMSLTLVGIIFYQGGGWLIENRSLIWLTITQGVVNIAYWTYHFVVRWGVTIVIWGIAVGVPVCLIVYWYVIYPLTSFYSELKHDPNFSHYLSFPRHEPDRTQFYSELLANPNFSHYLDLLSRDPTGALLYFELKHDPNFSHYFNLAHHDSVPNFSHLERVRAFIRELRHNVLALVWVASVFLCIYQVLFDLTALIIALFPPIIFFTATLDLKPLSKYLSKTFIAISKKVVRLFELSREVF